MNHSSFLQTLLHGNTFDKEKNTLILNAMIECIFSTKRLGEPLIKFPLESLNPSMSFLRFFIIFTSYLILLDFFIYYFIPRHFRIFVSGDYDF